MQGSCDLWSGVCEGTTQYPKASNQSKDLKMIEHPETTRVPMACQYLV